MTEHTTHQATGFSAQVINSNAMISADQVIRDCEPMIGNIISSLARAFDCPVNDFYRDEFMQIGRIKIWDLLENYDASRGRTLKTYLYQPVYFEVLHAFAEELDRCSEHDYYDERDEQDENAEDMWSDMPADPIYNSDAAFERQALREECEQRLSVLDSTDRQIVEMQFGLTDGFEHSNEAIAFELGFTAERARQRGDRAMTQLQIAA